MDFNFEPDREAEKTMQTYVPGMCNIGQRNRVFRLGYGLFFILLSAYLAFAFSTLSYATLAKTFLVIPLYVGFLGIYQALHSFCVHHAKKRTYDMR